MIASVTWLLHGGSNTCDEFCMHMCISYCSRGTIFLWHWITCCTSGWVKFSWFVQSFPFKKFAMCKLQHMAYSIMATFECLLWKPTLSLLPTPKWGHCCICWWGDCMNTAVCKNSLWKPMFGRFIFSKKYHYKVDNNYISLQGRQTANVVNIVHTV